MLPGLKVLSCCEWGGVTVGKPIQRRTATPDVGNGAKLPMSRKDLSIPSPRSDGRSPAWHAETPEMPPVEWKKGKGKARAGPRTSLSFASSENGAPKTGRRISTATIISAADRPLGEPSPDFSEEARKATPATTQPEAAPLPPEAAESRDLKETLEPTQGQVVDTAMSLDPEEADSAAGVSSPAVVRFSDEAMPGLDSVLKQQVSDASPATSSPGSGVAESYPELNGELHAAMQEEAQRICIGMYHFLRIQLASV